MNTFSQRIASTAQPIQAFNKSEVKKIREEMKAFGYKLINKQEDTLDSIKEAPSVYTAELTFSGELGNISLVTSEENGVFETSIEVNLKRDNKIFGFHPVLFSGRNIRPVLKSLDQMEVAAEKFLDALRSAYEAVDFLGDYVGRSRAPKP